MLLLKSDTVLNRFGFGTLDGKCQEVQGNYVPEVQWKWVL